MSRPNAAFAATTIVGLTVFGIVAVSLAGEPAISPQRGILVLRNGRVLSGQITRAGDRFLVAMGPEDEVSLPATAVEFHCRGMNEAYQLKRMSLRPANVDDMLDLAEWCLGHELYREAAQQLLAASALDPKHVRGAQLERRLQLAVRRPDDDAFASGLPKPTVSVVEVERVVSGLPNGVVERFTSQIQPLLINRCGTGGCHGPRGQTSFHLTAPSRGFRLTARTTQRNLFHVLKQIDRRQALQSALLQKPAVPHGGLATPVFRDYERAKFDQLSDWVRMLVSQPQLAQPATIDRPDSILLQPGNPMQAGAAGARKIQGPSYPGANFPANGPATLPRESRVQPASYEGRPTEDLIDVDRNAVRPLSPQHAGSPDPSAIRSTHGSLPPGRMAASGHAPQPLPPSLNAAPLPTSPHQRGVGQFRPRDPFDAEIFNRRYFSAGNPPPRR